MLKTMSLRSSQVKMIFGQFVTSVLVNSLPPLIRPLQESLELSLTEIGILPQSYLP
jgi:hypothetical protein